MMGIGLGTNSTLLNWLVSSGKIASRSWSYFWGRTTVTGASSSSSEQLDGSVVFGGYDRAKVMGTKYTQPMTSSEPDCPSQLVVTITNIELNFANGSDASIFPASSSAAITACLTPALSTLMWIPFDPYFNKFMNLTNNNIFDMGRSVGIYYWNMRYEASEFEPYDGDLTITLQSGLSVRISNQQLVQPHTSINQTTGAVLVNNTSPDLLLDSLQNVQATKLAQLGWQFFSAAYLLVNQDAHEFTLWEANPTSDQDLVAIDKSGVEITNFCAASADMNSTDSGDGGSGILGATSKTSATSVSTGVVAGSVVAGVAVIGIIAGLPVWWIRRRRARQMKEAIPSGSGASPYPGLCILKSEQTPSDYGSSVGFSRTEIDADGKRAEINVFHELYAKRNSDARLHAMHQVPAPSYSSTACYELQ